MPLPEPGFADPVAESQRAFRALLDAIAHPGRIVDIPGPAGRPEGLSIAQSAIALALLDGDTPVWLAGPCASARPWIAFHTGAPAAPRPDGARFAFAEAGELPAPGAFDLGTDAYPDRSTTLIIETPGLAAGGNALLSGPGIAGTTRATLPLPRAFFAARAELAELFPRGLDLVLTDGARALALPRGTRVEGA
ncbi:MAG: phosphonate C-P lyase system protein PhnH [Azospirillum sp.]|nr:phosphonate C-P lyase system protein PhnH [Azospirillum sp.]